jgi:regulatory protein YycI of two-component signal transduction system YycFG
MGRLVKAKEQNGIGVINKNISKFQTIVDGLDKGINLCDKEISANKKAIQQLGNRNDTVSKSKEQAKTFQNNLKSMLSSPTKEAKKEKKKDK